MVEVDVEEVETLDGDLAPDDLDHLEAALFVGTCSIGQGSVLMRQHKTKAINNHNHSVHHKAEAALAWAGEDLHLAPDHGKGEGQVEAELAGRLPPKDNIMKEKVLNNIPPTRDAWAAPEAVERQNQCFQLLLQVKRW